MTCVVTDACVNCRYGDCAEVCPVNAFHEGHNFMVINPAVCVNCSICISMCPVGAIKNEYDLMQDELELLEINAHLAGEWPAIDVGSGALPEAENWVDRPNKRSLILR